IKNITAARAKNGLLAGVDTSIANSEVSSAKIAYLKALNLEQEQNARLAVLMGLPPEPWTLDSSFVTKIPTLSPDAALNEKNHPLLKY
ncbi:MAG: transporter, partial [Candidatus Nephrothrix sp. EaCA]